MTFYKIVLWYHIELSIFLKVQIYDSDSIYISCNKFEPEIKYVKLRKYKKNKIVFMKIQNDRSFFTTWCFGLDGTLGVLKRLWYRYQTFALIVVVFLDRDVTTGPKPLDPNPGFGPFLHITNRFKEGRPLLGQLTDRPSFCNFHQTQTARPGYLGSSFENNVRGEKHPNIR